MPEFDLHEVAARADLCRFLAACFYQPGAEFAEEKVFDSLSRAASRSGVGLAAPAARLGEAFAAEGWERLLLDYTRLFLGPVEALARPYGSVWLGGANPLMQDSTLAAVALYEEGGFEIAEDFRELPDHVAVELEFLYLLLFREAQSRRKGETERLATGVRLRKRFLDEHLGRWIGPFATAVRLGAQCVFYRELASITEALVKLEAARTGDGG
jgi:TorA maturation chaperone TorD